MWLDVFSTVVSDTEKLCHILGTGLWWEGVTLDLDVWAPALWPPIRGPGSEHGILLLGQKRALKGQWSHLTVKTRLGAKGVVDIWSRRFHFIHLINKHLLNVSQRHRGRRNKTDFLSLGSPVFQGEEVTTGENIWAIQCGLASPKMGLRVGMGAVWIHRKSERKLLRRWYPSKAQKNEWVWTRAEEVRPPGRVVELWAGWWCSLGSPRPSKQSHIRIQEMSSSETNSTQVNKGKKQQQWKSLQQTVMVASMVFIPLMARGYCE